MPIKNYELDKMNEALRNGSTISKLAQKYKQYDYWEIYWEVSDASILGKKRTITNRIKKLVSTRKKEDREVLAEEAQELLNELYEQLKGNSKKLVDIDRILRR